MTRIDLIRSLTARVAGRATTDVADDSRFDALAIDSFALIELVLDVEDALQISIPDAPIDALETVQDLADLTLTIRPEASAPFTPDAGALDHG